MITKSNYIYLLFGVFLMLSACKRFVYALNWTEIKPQYCWGSEEYSQHKENKAIMVSVQLVLDDIFEVDEPKMEYSLNLILKVYWRDTSFKLESLNISCSKLIPKNIASCMWKPDIVFSICKKIHYLNDHSSASTTRLLKGGLLYEYNKYILVVSCKMEFQYYPMDEQTCVLQVKFLSSRHSEAILQWLSNSSINLPKNNENDIYIRGAVTALQFYVGDMQPSFIKKTSPSGTRTDLLCTFVFVRYLTASVINTYIPSFLVVCLSFVSFWLHVDAVPGRVTLGVTALLTLATQMDSARSSLPKVNYMTALDVWLLGCLILVFMTLVEFVIANSLSRNHLKNHTPHVPEVSRSTTESWTTNSETGSECNKLVKENVGLKLCKTPIKMFKSNLNVQVKYKKMNLDAVARILFPLVMALFTIIYWSFYLTQSKRI